MQQHTQLVLDQSTSGTKLLVVQEGKIIKRYDRKHEQIYPQIGWVEHDPLEIWGNVEELFVTALKENRLSSKGIQTLSLTNQRETVIIWDKTTGMPLYNAMVWQCNRSTAICESLIGEGKESLVSEKTGLRIDPYFSGSKIKWLMDEYPEIKEKSGTGELAIGTMDAWLIWKMTEGEVFATDASNACRTLLYNIHENDWDEDLLELFDVSRKDLPEIRNANALFGKYQGIPIQGVLADSQAALYGEDCINCGDVKITMGTGCSILMQVKEKKNIRDPRILTTLAWQDTQETTYALEGIIRSCGDALNWFGSQIAKVEEIAYQCNKCFDISQEEVYFIPALLGMGAPYWNNQMTASFLGMKRTTTQTDLLKAVLESLIFQIKSVIDTMEEVSQLTIPQVFVDGGISKNKALMAQLATLLNKKVIVSDIEEYSAIGTLRMATGNIPITTVGEQVYFPINGDTIIKNKYKKWNDLIQRFS
ncbi:FGGY-family carbohydrate kinase [Enterococcus lemanii]|uniref:ATP:glycerol 3-phosphotransferase n=1 Tax=Enterococcus lemanii TaxID=1159752 RepID=A0ABV9MST6_9ENTE|nr:FGGY family carbohydrate kinase [Enterococcus lemanii]MBM7709733.1 glycerol kinase [Enterococcus lemanii]